MSVGKKRRFKGGGRRFIQLYHNVNARVPITTSVCMRVAPCLNCWSATPASTTG